jgi:hypothetical protein
MADMSESANPELRRLQRRVLAGTGIRRPAVKGLLFHSLRGLALSHLMLGVLPHHSDEPKTFAEQQALLAQALALLIQAQGAQRS